MKPDLVRMMNARAEFDMHINAALGQLCPGPDGVVDDLNDALARYVRAHIAKARWALQTFEEGLNA